MSKLPYILGGGAAVLALGVGAWYLRRPAPAEGVPAGAKGGFFWQSPDGAPRESASLAELETSVRSAYGEQAHRANVLLPGMTSWAPADVVVPSLQQASWKPSVLPQDAPLPPIPPEAPLPPGKIKMTKLSKPIASVMGARNRWSGLGRDHLGNHR